MNPDDKIDLSSVNKTKKQFKFPKLKNPFKKGAGPGRDAEGKFISGSGGLLKSSNFNWKRAIPLMAVVALVGGFLVYKSFAGTYSACARKEQASSYEAECVYSSDEAVVIRTYYATLNRAPDKNGLKYWVGKLADKKVSATEIARQFLGSSEYKRKNGAPTNANFVKNMYLSAFEREADTAGLNYWTSQLDSKAKTRADMVAQLVASPEMKRIFSIRVGQALNISPLSLTSAIPKQYDANDVECYGTKKVVAGKTWCEQKLNEANLTHTDIALTVGFKPTKPLLGTARYIVCMNKKNTNVKLEQDSFSSGSAYTAGVASNINSELTFNTRILRSYSSNDGGTKEYYSCNWIDSALDLTKSTGVTFYTHSKNQPSNATYAYDLSSLYIGKVQVSSTVSAAQQKTLSPITSPNSNSACSCYVGGQRRPVKITWQTVLLSPNDGKVWKQDTSYVNTNGIEFDLDYLPRKPTDTTKVRLRAYDRKTNKDVPFTVKINDNAKMIALPLTNNTITIANTTYLYSVWIQFAPDALKGKDVRVEMQNVGGAPISVKESGFTSL